MFQNGPRRISKMARGCGIVAAAIALALALPARQAFGDQDGLKMRGVGATRQSLDALQLKPFSAALWSDLKDWSAEFKPESTGGKVVMIVTWAAWRSPSHSAMKLAQSLATKFKDKDFVVVGVHNPRGFDLAASNAKELGVTFPFAADPDGKFRAGIKGDADPNIYFIDRAGQLRYAQVDQSSAAAAAEKLLAETSEQAGAITGDLAAAHAAAERERFRTGNAGVGPIVEHKKVEFSPPDDETYSRAKWPYLIGSKEEDKIFNKIYAKAPKLEIGEENWVASKPDWNGRLLLLYVVDPLDPASMNVLPTMNALAIRHQAEVVVAGAAYKAGTDANLQGDELQRLVRRNTAAIQTLIATNRINHSVWAQPARLDNLEGLDFRHTSGRADLAIALLMSTDGKVRWIGNPNNRELVNRAIDAVLEVDPGIAARRRAELMPTKKDGE